MSLKYEDIKCLNDVISTSELIINSRLHTGLSTTSYAFQPVDTPTIEGYQKRESDWKKAEWKHLLASKAKFESALNEFRYSWAVAEHEKKAIELYGISLQKYLQDEENEQKIKQKDRESKKKETRDKNEKRAKERKDKADKRQKEFELERDYQPPSQPPNQSRNRRSRGVGQAQSQPPSQPHQPPSQPQQPPSQPQQPQSQPQQPQSQPQQPQSQAQQPPSQGQDDRIAREVNKFMIQFFQSGQFSSLISNFTQPKRGSKKQKSTPHPGQQTWDDLTKQVDQVDIVDEQMDSNADKSNERPRNPNNINDNSSKA